MKKGNGFESLGGLVYSTNDEVQQQITDAQTLPPQQQNLRVMLERKGGGKLATILTGFVGNEQDIKALEKKLKARCATGGSTKNGVIVLQGDFCVKIIEMLTQEGYKIKRSGG